MPQRPRALGMTVMENLLTAHPDLKAVFATNDQMALGAVEAIAAHNLTGKENAGHFL